MKHLYITTTLVTFYLFASSVAFAQELGEFCWKERGSTCVLKLNVTQHNKFYSFVGNEICPDVARTAHATGSGYTNGGQVNFGLNFIAQEPGTDPAIPLSTYKYGLFGTINLADLFLSGQLDIVDEPANYDATACGS